ncbi:MAG: CDGSH iron-sulfur domain-containing protein [Myxococcales bacterium]|nr:CDGSH iron-sulfur domain-containing protein [Myxococcales bacterium]
MTKPRCVDRKGVTLEIAPGAHYWCACGRSRNQPFCDGSHAGTGFEPVEVVVSEPTTVRFCLCKRTRHAPRCDGSHGGIASHEVDGPMDD